MYQIIEKLGGWSEAQSMLAERGIPASDNTCKKWRQRRSLPQKVILALMAEADERDIPYEASDFEWAEREAA